MRRSSTVPGLVRAAARAIVGALLMAAVAACATPAPSTDPRVVAVVTVGSVESAESVLAAEIYADVLRRLGRTVRVASPVPDRTAALAALDAGSVTLIPERTGDLLDYLDPTATAVAADDVYAAVVRALPAGLAAGDYAEGDAAAVPARDLFPVYRAGALADADRRALNRIAGELDAAELDALVARERAGERSADLAASWLDGRAAG